MNIGYKRVSTKEQTTARQLIDVPLDRIYEEHVSGATMDRPELARCLDALREGDTLHVHAIDRLSRSMRDLLNIVDVILKVGANLIIYYPKLEIKTQEQDYMQKFQLGLWAMVGEMERDMSRERRTQGIAAAKLNGTKSGKPFGKPPLDLSRRIEAIEHSKKGLNISQISRAMKLSRTSIYKLLS